jgi:hypothetical protein
MQPAQKVNNGRPFASASLFPARVEWVPQSLAGQVLFGYLSRHAVALQETSFPHTAAAVKSFIRHQAIIPGVMKTTYLSPFSL